MNANVINQHFEVDLTPDEKQRLDDGLQAYLEILVPRMVSLGSDDKRGLVKMGSKSVDFVSKNVNYVGTNPEFKPGFFEAGQLNGSVSTYSLLRFYLQPFRRIADMLEDSVALAGSNAMTMALAYYQSVKTAEKMNVPGAATIAADLGERFAGQTGRPAASAAPQA